MSEKRCSHCGKLVQEGEKYCSDCGFHVGRRGVVRILLDHVIVVAILAVVALAYIGYNTVIADRTPPMKKTEAQSHGMPPLDMDQFVAGLPTDFATVVSMGNALMDQGQYQKAVACYNRALEQDSSATDVWVDLGTCEHAMGHNEVAIGDFQKALALNPQHQIARFNLGIVYYTLGDDSMAVQWWQSLLADSLESGMREHLEELIRQAQGG
jgi:cytochrome c-type biogenesis protein CcmH/NrfG